MSESVVSWAFVAWGVLWMRDGLEDKIVVYKLIVCVCNVKNYFGYLLFVGVQVVRWAAGCVLRFSLWSAAVLRFLGVRCYRIEYPFLGAIEVFDTLRCYNSLLVPLVVMQYV